MRILVLGATGHGSGWIAAEGAVRGHEVICAARGRSGTVPPGARLVKVDRSRPGALAPLAGQRFDAVVDVAYGALGWVREALATLDAGHWTFVSSINTYADTATQHQTADAPQVPPVYEEERVDLADTTPEHYGGIEVASEHAVRDTMGARSLIVRPGPISGPGDKTDRFAYWAGRCHRGGPVVVPDDPAQPIQHLDARDLARWVITAAEQRLTGAFDAVGPVRDFLGTLTEIAAVVGRADTELVPIAPADLLAAGVHHWQGPASLPMWLPEPFYGLVSHDWRATRDAGLTIRPFADTVHAALEEDLRRGNRPRAAGLTDEEHAALLS
ncbi:NAD-dependent epimerase/dehydratase family protein [Amycolatopsis albispora]|uniref:Epimerase n=1 Tax=Amycolatopsis albispora TaxID=1804986 RepID=A0A344KZ77_9PSEU|nr:NAD-dependent epimerase/dehydratase family protein [Amycolatopsis albispora]AXB41101.1 epimerase [Amycolatopsis albispora]